ncbi:MAG: hypothetical protein JO297_01955 [Nitrososphaeraceae archaeon]|nr:hypothetical protein [Nitrososphaeraceae archaeon]
MSNLYNEKWQVEQFVFRFKNGNRKYLMVRGIAEQIIRLLTEQGPLLTSAIMAVVHALRES